MFLALKLLLIISVLSWGVSAYIAQQIAQSSLFTSPAVTAVRSQNDPVGMLVSASAAQRPFRQARVTQLMSVVLENNYPLTTVETLRRVYGPRRKWWGDLSAQQTRQFYHELLPVTLQFEAGDSYEVLSLEERARLASTARHAARLYARERCTLVGRLSAHLYDGLRHFKQHGTWRSTGMNYEELWAKYEQQVRAAMPDACETAIREAVCKRILEKSCVTNQMFDALAGMAATEAAQVRQEKEQALSVMADMVKRKIGQVKARVTRPAMGTRAPMLRSPADQFMRT